MHSEQHTELDNLITMQPNLRNSAKGSNDAYDVSVSLTEGKFGTSLIGTLSELGAFFPRRKMCSKETKVSVWSNRHL